MHCRGDAAANGTFSSVFSPEGREAALPSHGEGLSRQNPSERHRLKPPRPTSRQLLAAASQHEVIRRHEPPPPCRAGSGPAGMWRTGECQRSLPSSPLSQLSLLAESSDHSASPFPGYTVSAASGWRVAETFPRGLSTSV